jgi:hypothetical protein
MQETKFLEHSLVNDGVYALLNLKERDEQTTPGHVFLVTRYTVLSDDKMLDRIGFSAEVALDGNPKHYTGFHESLKDDYGTDFLEEVLNGEYDLDFVTTYNDILDGLKEK